MKFYNTSTHLLDNMIYKQIIVVIFYIKTIFVLTFYAYNGSTFMIKNPSPILKYIFDLLKYLLDSTKGIYSTSMLFVMMYLFYPSETIYKNRLRQIDWKTAFLLFLYGFLTLFYMGEDFYGKIKRGEKLMPDFPKYPSTSSGTQPLNNNVIVGAKKEI